MVNHILNKEIKLKVNYQTIPMCSSRWQVISTMEALWETHRMASNTSSLGGKEAPGKSLATQAIQVSYP